MNFYKNIAQYLQRSSVTCAAIYCIVMFAFLTACCLLIANLQNQRESLAATTKLLEQLQGRSASRANGGINGEKNVPQGQPFLEGRTVTIAGAGLLERVLKAITTAGGRIVSSQVDLQTTQSNPGLVSVIINCEVEQMNLQNLLFDLEAGMPFLFIDQLEIQASDLSASSRTAVVRVILTTSGQWLSKQ